MKKEKDWYYTEKEAYKVQQLARHQMIVKLLNDILIDLQICKIEGWDKMEYVNMIKNEINKIHKKINK